jgi:hypothetical protein
MHPDFLHLNVSTTVIANEVKQSGFKKSGLLRVNPRNDERFSTCHGGLDPPSP